MIAINTSNQPLMLSPEEPRLPSHGKRKISLLDYDPTGLRTTKTTTWETTGKELEKWKPNHLPEATWMKDIDNILQECERKGIPVAVGKRYRPAVTPKNYNTVRW